MIDKDLREALKAFIDEDFTEAINDAATIVNSGVTLVIDRSSDLGLQPRLIFIMLQYAARMNLEMYRKQHPFPDDMRQLSKEIDPDKDPEILFQEMIEALISAIARHKVFNA